MKKTLLIAVLASAFACGKGEEEAPKKTEPATKPAPAEPPRPAEPPKPAAPEYSPEASAKLAADLEKCEYDFNCDAYKPLVGFGAKAAPDLAKIAADASKPAKGRAVAAKALAEIKDPSVGMQLFEAAKAEKDFMLRGDLFEAAGKSGNEEVLKAAGAYLLTEEGWDNRTEANDAIVPFGKKAFDWAAAELAKRKDKFAVALADVMMETAQAGDEATLKDLAAKTKDKMAANRLASKSVELGDAGQISILVTNLEKGDEYERSDAGNMLARIADKIPADQKAKIIELAKAAKEKDKGGLTSRGYDTLLKKLE